MKKIEGHFLYPVHPIRKLALRARRVKAELDPEGRGKDLVGKGFGTVRARLAGDGLGTVRARLASDSGGQNFEITFNFKKEIPLKMNRTKKKKFTENWNRLQFSKRNQRKFLVNL